MQGIESGHELAGRYLLRQLVASSDLKQVWTATDETLSRDVTVTVFDASGALDLDGQRRAIDFMIEAGSEGLCILANFSEQFVLTDDERETVMHAVLEHVAGRVPVIVTTTHFATQVCAERSRRAQDAGAAMVMIMPPYHGALLRAEARLPRS